MSKERGRRRRGRRRGRRERPPSRPPEERPEEVLPIGEESEAPGVLPSHFTFWRRRRDEGGGAEETRRRPPSRERAREQPTARRVSVSPLGFWRRSQARPRRQRSLPRRGPLPWWRRVARLDLPPWVPVVAIIIVVFVILGLLFFSREATGAPRTGDHWHATYQITICGQRQPNIPRFPGGVHTHGDGIIHIHPQIPSEEGAGARLVKWFEYGGGELTQSEMRIPGQSKTWKNGDLCEDGTEGVLQVFVNGERMGNWSRYIPQDGDRVRIVFGQEEGAIPEGEGIVIPPAEATREISIEAGDQGSPDIDSFFAPNTFTIAARETVKVNVQNTGTVSHNLRIRGVDEEYGTEDDFVSRPLIILPGEEGFAVVRIDEPGQYAFRCDIHPSVQFGTLIVEGEGPASTPGGAPTPGPTPAPP